MKKYIGKWKIAFIFPILLHRLSKIPYSYIVFFLTVKFEWLHQWSWLLFSLFYTSQNFSIITNKSTYAYLRSTGLTFYYNPFFIVSPFWGIETWYKKVVIGAFGHFITRSIIDYENVLEKFPFCLKQKLTFIFVTLERIISFFFHSSNQDKERNFVYFGKIYGEHTKLNHYFTNRAGILKDIPPVLFLCYQLSDITIWINYFQANFMGYYYICFHLF